MASTTVVFPGTYTPYIFSGGLLNTLTAPGVATPTSTTLAADFTLYLSQTVTTPAQLNIATLIDALDGPAPSEQSATSSTNTVPAYYNSLGRWVPVTGSFYPVTSGEVWLIPVISTLDSEVSLATLTPKLDQAYAALGSGGAATPAGSPTLSLSGQATTSAGSSVATSPGATNGATNGSASPSDHGISSGTLGGAVAGAAIGGLVVGAAIGLLVYLCCFKRRHPQSPAVTPASARDTSGTASTVERKVPYASETAMPVTGWQKHLPQEKDNRTIRDALQNLFDHIEMHIDGYYDSSPVGLSSGAIHALESISGDGTGDMIPTSRNVLPLLQSILARFIIHRISLRARAEQSFLPDEYTTMPEMYGWHMENDEREKSVSSNSQKGLPQAFSQWQMLTAFLRPNTQGDAEFRKALNAKINNAVHSVSEAFAPWERPEKNRTNRAKSLQSILEEASQAGIMIFRQRSLYTFDWSSGGRMDGRYVVVTPGLFKDIDEYGEPLRPSQRLIEATRQSC